MKAIDFQPRKTVTSAHFSDAEIALLSEALRIAQRVVLKESTRLNDVYPNSPMVERFRIDAEAMADLREKVEAA